MQYEVVGIFRAYSAAEAAVRDLELAGIEGEQVQMISDMDGDVRTVDTAGEPSTEHRKPHRSGLARLFGGGGNPEEPEVRADAGEQPNYIGEQEYYASHIKQGGAVLIVRASTEKTANSAAEIMSAHGAHKLGRKEGPAVQRIDSR
jgi:hypothetical protein